jgi:hypothetical protein
MTPKKPRPKKCKACGQSFQPWSSTAVCCSWECAHNHVVAKRQKEEQQAEKEARKAIRVAKEAAKKPSKLKAEAWTAFSAYVRTRDEGKRCISCETILVKRGAPGGDYDAGHFRAKGGAKHLEFDERNVHGQCKYCNRRLGGNYANQEPELIRRIGMEAFLALKADNEPRRLRAEDYRAIKAHYTAKRRELIAARQTEYA